MSKSMNKREKNNVVWAMAAIIAVCLIMAFLSGCKPKLEVGQVWETPSRGDPFKVAPPVRQKILALEDGYVQFERLDEPAKGYIGSYSERVFKVGNIKLVPITPERPLGIDITAPDVIEIEDETNLIVIATSPLEFKIGQVWESETDNPFDVHVLRKILAMQDGYVKYDRVDGEFRGTGIGGSMSIVIFRSAADKLIDLPEEPEPLIETPAEPNAPPIWGKGELPAEYTNFFGTDNPARLNWMQNQVLDRHGKIIAEIAKRVLILEYVDPNEVAK